MDVEEASRWLGIAAGVMALAIASPALGQEEGARHMHDPERRIQRLTEALDLTDAQVAEIRSIFAEQRENGRELRENGDHEAMQAHMRETHERLAAVLTPEQREKLEDLRQRFGERRGGRHGEDGHGGDHPRHPRDG